MVTQAPRASVATQVRLVILELEIKATQVLRAILARLALWGILASKGTLALILLSREILA